MDDSSQRSGQSEGGLSIRGVEKTLRNVMVLAVICTVIATVGAGFGIYATIQANRAISELEEGGYALDDGAPYDYEESKYEKPTSADEIKSVWISYNNQEDYIDIYDGTVSYYSYNAEDEEVGGSVEVDAKELKQYIFDNDLKYISDTEHEGTDEDVTWSLEVDTEDGYSYVDGTGEEPEWFKQLLEKLDVNTHGYTSRK